MLCTFSEFLVRMHFFKKLNPLFAIKVASTTSGFADFFIVVPVLLETVKITLNK